MKRGLLTLLAIFSLCFLFQNPMVFADGEDTHKNQIGKGHTEHGQGKGLGHHKDGSGQAVGNARLGISSKPGEITVKGLATGNAVSGSNRATGSATGTLRITWGSGSSASDRLATNTRGLASNNVRSIFRRLGSPVSPPGAPELPANVLFGSGFLILGFGLMLYRRLW